MSTREDYSEFDRPSDASSPPQQNAGAASANAAAGQSSGQSNVPPHDPDDDTISLLDLVAVLAKHWRLIFFSTMLGAVGVFAFLMWTARLPAGSDINPLPNVYKAEVKLLFQEPEGAPSLGRFLGGDSGLGGLAGLIGGAAAEVRSDAALAEALLRGNTVLDSIIDELDLMADIDMEDKDPARVRAGLRRSLRTGIELEREGNGIFVISYTSGDPEAAAELVALVVEILEERFRSINLQTVSQKRRFLERRIAEIQDDLRQAQTELFAFQQEYGLFNLSDQSRQMVDQIASLSREVIQKEVEIESLREYLDPNAAQIQRLRNEIAVANRLIENLRRGQLGFMAGDMDRATLSARMIEQMNVMANVEINQGLLSLTTTQLEEARIQEQDQSRRFFVLEPVEVPVERAGPRRAQLAIITTISIFFLAIFLSFVLEYLDRVKQDPEESRKLASIRGSLPLINRIRPRSKA